MLFDLSKVTKEWMQFATKDQDIESVESVQITAGGTPAPKLLITTHSKDGQIKHYFAKTSWVDPALSEDLKNAVKKSHRREGSFYKFNFFPKVEFTAEQVKAHREFLERCFVRCYYVDDDVILLDNPTKGDDSGFTTVSAWNLNEPAPNTPVNILHSAVETLALLHAKYWGEAAFHYEESKELLTWDQLIEARISRIYLDRHKSGNPENGDPVIIDRVKHAGEFFKCPPHIINFMLKVFNNPTGLQYLWRKCYNILGPKFATVCHGDSNPGNMLAQKEGKGNTVVLIDFQEPIVNGPSSSDLARVVISALSRCDRCQHTLYLLNHYFEKLKSSLRSFNNFGENNNLTWDQFYQSFLCCLFADALFIIAVVPEQCLNDPNTILLNNVVQRSIEVLLDYHNEFEKLL